jgi:PKD domain
MKSIKKAIYLETITLVIVGLLITSTATIIAQNQEPETHEKYVYIAEGIIKKDPVMLQVVPENLRPTSVRKVTADDLFKTTDTKTLGVDKQLFEVYTDQEALPNVQNAQIASNGKELFVMAQATDGVLESSLIVSSSADKGATWSEPAVISDYDAVFYELPAIDYTGDAAMEAYGSHKIDLVKGSFQQLLVCFPSLSDSEAIYQGSTEDFTRAGWFDGYVFTWQDIWGDIPDTATAGYKHGVDVSPFKNFHGVTTWSGYYDSSVTGWTYYLMCETDEDATNPYLSLWYNILPGTLGQIDCDIDVATGWEYDAWEMKSPDNGWPDGIDLEILLLEPGNPEWYTNTENYGPSYYFNNTANPALAADQGNLYLACEKDGDIVCMYSSDNGQSISEAKVTNTAGIEENPTIMAIGKVANIQYIRDGTLYASTSTDGGKTWVESLPINDVPGSAVSEPHSSDVQDTFVVWTDDRSGANRVYFDVLVLPLPETPIITGPASGDADKTYEYTFVTTDPKGDQVSYFIDWGDGSTTDWTSPSASGVQVKQSHTWDKKGNYTIKAKAKNTAGVESSWGTLTVSMPVEINTPFRLLLEKLFERFPHTFPILRHLLG